VCDIKGSFANVFPIIVEKDFQDPRQVERPSNFWVFKNSTSPKPAAHFRVGEVITGHKELLTQLQNFGALNKLKFFLRFSSAQMVLNCKRTETLTSGKLQSASIGAIKG
jgi:hypothetical protein